MRKRLRLVAGVAVAAAATAVAGLYASRSTHVALKITLDPTAVRPRSRCLLNPFRDRAPERLAEGYLQRMRRDGPDVVRSLVPAADVDAYMEDEARYPIQSWRVGDREDSDRAVRLVYWVRRGGGYPADEEEVAFWLRGSSGSWQVWRYTAIY